MSVLSQTASPRSTITGTRLLGGEPGKAVFSVKRQAIVRAFSPLCASAMRMRQQYGLNRCSGSAPASSYKSIILKSRHLNAR